MLKAFLKECYKFIFSLVCILVQIFPDSPWGNRVRGAVIGLFFKGTKRNLQISQSVHVLYPYNIVVGDNVFIGFSSWINAQGGLQIGDETIIGPFVAIATGNHTWLNGSYRFGEHDRKMVNIGKGCWLASGVSIVPGVSVADACVLAAGAVLVADAMVKGTYGGVPAKLIRGERD